MKTLGLFRTSRTGQPLTRRDSRHFRRRQRNRVRHTDGESLGALELK